MMEFYTYVWFVLVTAQLKISLYFCKDVVPSSVSEYEAVAGGDAILPCNFTLPEDPDLVSLMLWYRGAQERSPIYTVDFRKGDQPRHFRIPGYADRTYFDVARVPPALKIHAVTTQDEGIYRCQIEFRRLRTVTRMVKLKILIPPSSIVILDDRGQRMRSIAGPYDEGAYLSLLCEADGGDPTPRVTWWRGHSLIDDTYFRASPHFVRNEFVIMELRRSDLMVELRCEASSTNLTRPLIANVKIDLNLRPLYARITTAQRTLNAGENIRLHCESSGSRPPAKISWWLDSKRVQTGKESIPNSRNITYSSLALAPTIEDNGKVITCKADNPTLAHPNVQDSWYLNIFFPPEVSLQLGANIKYSTIKEGNDVYMECITKSNPPISELTWLFEGKAFLGNASAGVIISNQSLVLQKVRKEHRGRYRCIAANSEGEEESGDLLLEVRYPPVCKPDQRDLYGVAREETVEVSCSYEADPPDLQFRWSLNNSLDNAALHSFHSSGSSSVLMYTPRTSTDYGVLQCWGRNSVGDPREPCVVRIIPAGPPDPVRNCVVVNQSDTCVQMECEAGYGNGLLQRFHLEVYNSAVDHLQANLTSHDTPTFGACDLPSGTPFVLVVYASNEKGKSNTLAIVGHTLEKNMGNAESAFMSRLSPLVAILLSTLGTFLIIGVIGIGLVQIRRKRPPKTSIEEDNAKIDMVLKKSADEIAETAIACPDVVPPNNTLYASPDGEAICEIKENDRGAMKDNYRNCVVSLKRSWSFKKGHQEKVEVDMMLTDINTVIADPLNKSSTSLLGDVTLEECYPSKKIVIRVEPPPEGDVCHGAKLDKSDRTDSV